MKRKLIEFVAAAQDSTHTPIKPTRPIPAGERYLSIVFKDGTPSKKIGTTGIEDGLLERPTGHPPESKDALCGICNLPVHVPEREGLGTPKLHEASIAHMVCLKHSHPPSDLDRNRLGLKCLSSYGWDPESRLGLGTNGEGIRAPIKVKVKNDTMGLGVHLKEGTRVQERKRKPLDAKQARKRDLESKKKTESLQEMFYGNDDVWKYSSVAREI